MILDNATSNIVYGTCLAMAKSSLCKKARFGAVLYNQKSGLCVVGANNPIPALAHVCEPDCIRMKIKSRTESMIGACGHAEEAALWAALKSENYEEGVLEDILQAEIFVLGLDAEGKPLVKSVAEFTCIRCATGLYLAGVRGVNVWMGSGWATIPIGDAIKQAHDYATQIRDVGDSYVA